MGDIQVNEGFLDTVMIRVTATGAAATGLVPTCTVMKISDGSTVGLTVAELTLGVYKVTDWAPNADTEYFTIWAVAGAYTIYSPFKLFKVGGGDVQAIYDLIKAAGAGDVAAILVDTGTSIPALIAALNNLAQADILSDATPFDGADIAAILTDTDAAIPALIATLNNLAQADILNDATPFDGVDIADILVDTGTTIPALIATLENISAATVEAECIDAIESFDLDHLIHIAHPSGDPVADSLIDLIMNKGAGQTFNRATDSLEALAEAIAAAGGGDATEAKQDTIIALLDSEIADIIADIGVFPTANYATLAAYVEDIRTRLIAIVADTGTIVWGDITGIVNDIGVFPTANYATLAAYVEDIRARMIVILADVTGLNGDVMRGTDGAALVGDGWDAALATILDNFTPVRIGYLDELHPAAIPNDLNWLITNLTAIIADIGVFPTANYATLAAYVEDVRTRLIAIVGDTNELQISLADGGFTDLLIDSIIERTSNLPDDPADASVIAAAHALLATEAKQDIIDTLIDGLVADIGVFPTANYATFAAYVEDIRTQLIAILADTGTTLDDLLDGLVADVGVFPTANYATLAAYVEDIRTRLLAIVEDTGTTLENRQDAMQTRLNAQRNSELFGSVMQEEVQLGAAAADVNMPNIILPNITGTIVRVYLHFKYRMVENTYDGANALQGAQSIRIKKSTGAWGVDDIAAITFADNNITLAALTREGGDVHGGMIDLSGEVDVFNATYNTRWEDGDVDQDFINFNDVEMFLRVVYY